jgi:hypothetical protein
MEKRGVIARGWTPPERTPESQPDSQPAPPPQDARAHWATLFGASAQMTDHLTARLAEATTDKRKPTPL